MTDKIKNKTEEVVTEEVVTEEVVTEEVVEETIETVEVPETVTQTIPEEKLSLSDLNTMRQIIEICGSRGAIRANEMTTVGALHNKLHAFLVQAGVIPVAQQGQQVQQATDTGTAPATAEEDPAE